MAVVDISGAFLQTNASDGTIINLQGSVVEALLTINPTWNKFVVYVGKNPYQPYTVDPLKHYTEQWIYPSYSSTI